MVEREAPGGQAGTSSRIENYLGFPSGVSGDELASRALQQARRLGAEILVTRSITRIDAADAARCTSTAATSCARGRSSSPAACRGGTCRSRASTGWSARASPTAPPAARRSNAHGLDVHIVGAGNSAGQAALFFATHARSVTILCRGDRLEKSMSRYLVDQLANAVEHRRACSAPRWSPRTATGRSRRSTSGPARPARRPGSNRAGSSSSSGPTPRRRGCRRRSRSTTTATCSRAPTWRRERVAARPRPVPARDERPGRLRLRRRPLQPGQAGRRGGRRGQHGDRVRAPVPARRAVLIRGSRLRATV